MISLMLSSVSQSLVHMFGAVARRSGRAMFSILGECYYDAPGLSNQGVILRNLNDVNTVFPCSALESNKIMVTAV